MLLGLFYTNRLPFFSLAEVVTRAWTECTDCFIVAIFPETHLPRPMAAERPPPNPIVWVLQPSRPAPTSSSLFLRPPRYLSLGDAHLPPRPCLSSGNEPFARGQWDCTLKAPPYHAPGYLLLRSGPDGTSTFRCPRSSVSLPSEQYLWARESAPKSDSFELTLIDRQPP